MEESTDLSGTELYGAQTVDSLSMASDVPDVRSELENHSVDVSGFNSTAKASDGSTPTRVALTYSQKRRIKEYHDRHRNLTQCEVREWVKETFALDIGRSTVSRILRLQNIEHGSGKRKRPAKFPDLEDELYAELQPLVAQSAHDLAEQQQQQQQQQQQLSNQIQESNCDLTDAVIVEYAKRIRHRLGIEPTELKLSAGWITAFKSRFGLKVSNPKRFVTRQTLTIHQKLKLKKYFQKKPELTYQELRSWVERQFGVAISRSTIGRILSTDDWGFWNTNMKRKRSAKFPILEEQLYGFILEYERIGPISDAVILEKAKQLRESHNITASDFKLSNGWLHGFKVRYGIRLRAVEKHGGDSKSGSSHEPQCTSLSGTDHSSRHVPRKNLQTILKDMQSEEELENHEIRARPPYQKVESRGGSELEDWAYYSNPDENVAFRKQSAERISGKGLSGQTAEAFSQLNRELKQYEEITELILKQSAAVVKLSKQAVLLLQRGSFDKAQFCIARSKRLIRETQKKIGKNMQLNVEDFVSAKRKYAEAKLLQHYLETHKLLSRNDFAFLDGEDYFHGLIGFAGEITTFSRCKSSALDTATIINVRNLLKDIFGRFVEFNIRNADFIAQIDSIKANVETLEYTLYELSMAH